MEKELTAFANSNKLIFIFDLIKIGLIIFFAFSVVTQMYPYFYGADTSLYGTTAINFVNGSWGIQNELLKKTGLWEFVPFPYTKTIHNDAVPLGGLGMHGMSALAYILGGQYGLLYLGPAFTILLLILIDQISLKLFGRFVAFVSVLIAASSYWILGYGVQLLSESIFAFFFLLGIYFLIKFYRDKNATSILFSSTFLVTATFLRTNGIISLPLETLLVLLVLFLPILQNNKNLKPIIGLSKFYFYYKQNKPFLRIVFFMVIPWVFFFFVSGIYNYYFFGDPSLSPYEARPYSELEFSLKHAVKNLNTDIFTWSEYLAVFLLPDKLFSIISNGSHFVDVTPWTYLWIGLFSLLILLSAIIISFLTKDKRVDIIILSLFVCVTLVFFALGQMSRVPDLEQYTPRNLVISFKTDLIRYMVPVFPLYYMIFGFTMYKIWKINTSISKLPFKTLVKCLKLCFLALVILFLFTSFYDSLIVKTLKKGSFTNPQTELEKHFPINRELPEKSVIVSFEPYKTIEYGFIPLFPFWGFNFVRIDLEPDLIPQAPISTIKNLLGDVSSDESSGAKTTLTELKGYQVFTFKKHNHWDTIYYRYLESNHGIILKDYSKIFCKMKLVDKTNFNGTISKSDKICY